MDKYIPNVRSSDFGQDYLFSLSYLIEYAMIGMPYNKNTVNGTGATTVFAPTSY
jgi:hypothetical protein